MLNSQERLVCKPLDTYKELLGFALDPPVWKSMCKGIKPHSEYLIRNSEERNNFDELMLENPLSYCHFDPDDLKQPSRHKGSKLPKTLVCHDMANGYHDDSVIEGTSCYDAYTFYNWAGIDIFCYFSHHLITIPPLGWINVGHAHGVKVIGTVITEWNSGIAFWDKVLSSEQEMQHCISALVVVAKTLHFDGWLLNVENKIAQPGKLLEFVRGLHLALHSELPAPVLLWYDSVTVDGQLNWQNKLNSKNKEFFDACDGFFTNYSWSMTDALESVSAAGDRLPDLFVGIDVWGRNFFGGGQFNTQEAVKIVHSLGCSLAIFAPAWSHEAAMEGAGAGAGVARGEHLSRQQRLTLRDRALWGSLWPFLNTRLPCALPFHTSFCRGQGRKRRRYGEVICPVPWYNLRHMQYQPNAAHGPHGYVLVVSPRDDLDHGHVHGPGLTIRDSDDDKSPENNSPEIYKPTRRDSRELVKFRDSNELRNPEPPTSSLKAESDERSKPKTTVMEQVKQFFKKTLSPCPSQKSMESVDSKVTHKTCSRNSIVIQDVNMLSTSQIHNARTKVYLAHVPNELECLEVFYEDSFTGGSCLKINPSDLSSSDHRTSRLFYCDFFCEDTLIICFVTKILAENTHQYLNVLLNGVNGSGNEVNVDLIGRNVATRGWSSALLKRVYPCLQTTKEFRDLQQYILLNHPDFYVPTENSFGWQIWYFQVDLPDVQIRSINCRTGELRGGILLGHLGLCHRERDINMLTSLK